MGTMDVARKVKQLRYNKGWGPDELAERAGISRTALYQIECGKTEMPRAGTLKKVAKALEVDIKVLLDHDPPTHNQVAQHRDMLQDQEIQAKLQALLDSPWREGIASVIETTYRSLLPLVRKRA